MGVNPDGDLPFGDLILLFVEHLVEGVDVELVLDADGLRVGGGLEDVDDGLLLLDELGEDKEDEDEDDDDDAKDKGAFHLLKYN